MRDSFVFPSKKEAVSGTTGSGFYVGSGPVSSFREGLYASLLPAFDPDVRYLKTRNGGAGILEDQRIWFGPCFLLRIRPW